MDDKHETIDSKIPRLLRRAANLSIKSLELVLLPGSLLYQYGRTIESEETPEYKIPFAQKMTTYGTILLLEYVKIHDFLPYAFEQTGEFMRTQTPFF